MQTRKAPVTGLCMMLNIGDLFRGYLGEIVPHWVYRIPATILNFHKECICYCPILCGTTCNRSCLPLFQNTPHGNGLGATAGKFGT